MRLLVVELIRLGGHRVLATEPVALELERLGQVRICDRQQGEQQTHYADAEPERPMPRAADMP
jgi:hypothetical protein